LGEIESALARLPGVRQAVVIVREDRPGDRRLVAYVVAAGQGAAVCSLRESLLSSLPDYMVPRNFEVLESLPLTGSGKIDRRALPAPKADVPAAEDRAPETPGEQLAARHFCQTLAVPRVGVSGDFFALGGHSLLAAQMSARIAAETGHPVPMSVIFERPTVGALGRWIDEFQQAGIPAAGGQIVARADPRQPAPLSLMQQRVWYVELLQPGTAQFNVPSAHRLTGVFNAAALEQALAKMVARQSALRTIVREIGGEPCQVVLDSVDVRIDIEDLTAVEQGSREARLQQRLAVEVARPFDVHRAPLFRARLFRLGAEEHVLFFMTHHLVWDGWSFDLFYAEMAELYAAGCEGRAAKLPDLAVSYADFSAWHRDWMKGDVLDQQVAYWRERLMGAPESLQLPIDRPRPAMQSGDGGTVWVHVPAAPVNRLRAIAQAESGTIFMSLLTLWALVLHRQTGQREVVIGTPVRGRSQPETETVMGFFVNAIPLRITIPSEGKFLDALRSVRRQVIEAFGFQDVPFEHLVRVLGSSRDQSRFPIYQSFFSYQDARSRSERWGSLQHRNVPVFQPAAAQDIALWFLDGADGLVGGLNYNSDILEAGTVERIRATFLEMLERVAADPELGLDALLRPGASELAQLHAWNDTDAPLPDMGLAQYLVSVPRVADDIVLRSGADAWTAAKLDRAVNAVAVRLHAA
ncbi:MAG: condensation domain-containing protein, partial [Steroidobacteraceae bacterium]